MLERLVVSNLVVIRDADLQLGPGLTVLTGETGAGKTIVTGALDLALGGRTDSSLVGPNGPEAYVEAAFALPPGMLAREAFDGVRELAGEEDEPLILARRVTADGRGRALACGRATTRAALAAAGEELVSVVSQHEARALTRPAVQRTLLDGFAGPKQVDRLHAMADAWHGLAEARRALAAAESDAAGADRLIDDLGDLVRRVDAVAPEPGESERLRAERERLRHADALLQAAGGAAHLLEPTDGDGAVTSVGLAERALAAAEGFDPELATIGGELRDALVRLEEVARSLHGYAAGVESDPARLEQLEGRLELLDDLARRHGSVEGALQAADEARDRLERLGNRDTELVRLREAETAAAGVVRKAADDLSTARRRPARSSRGRSSASWPTSAWPRRGSTCASRRASPAPTAPTRCACWSRPTPAARGGASPRRRRAASCRASRSPSASPRRSAAACRCSCSTRSTPASAAARRARWARSSRRCRRPPRSSASRTSRRWRRSPTTTSAS